MTDMTANKVVGTARRGISLSWNSLTARIKTLDHPYKSPRCRGSRVVSVDYPICDVFDDLFSANLKL